MDPAEYALNYLEQMIIENIDWPATDTWSYILRRLDALAAVPPGADPDHPRRRGLMFAQAALENEIAAASGSSSTAAVSAADTHQLSAALQRAVNRLTEDVGKIRAARSNP